MSEPNVAIVENASEVVKGGTRELQRGAAIPASVAPVPEAAHPKVELHNDNILEEPRTTGHTLPQGNAERPGAQKSSNSYGDLPIPENKVPKPDGDPFEYLLRPMLEKDTVQCTAWKDEVQNILIFAGLFSAVVTAFIIESYKRLQPDSNDAIVGLLALIAERLDNAPNQTDSVSSIITSTDFAPPRSDININVFWFISLVLSLTAALIGIITLQWLREHQRYDTALKPRETMAILNARLHSFKQWYVPQIFAGLPLLLQGALVLFFAGMIEFLFALRLEVAIPVTLAICVPLIFLLATTILPILQVYILQDAFRLSINNDVPSPCPYKSPQSLIARRVGLGSKVMFKSCASLVASAYICVVKLACFLRKLAGRRLPIFHSQRPHLKSKLRDSLSQGICEIRYAPGDWVSIDTSWLKVRTTYALSLQMVHREDRDIVPLRVQYWSDWSLLPELYDCTSCFHETVHQNRAYADLFSVLCDCIAALCSQALDNFLTVSADRNRDIEHSLQVDLCFAFGRFACNNLDMTRSPITTAFINDVIHHPSSESSDGSQTMLAAFIASWIFAIDDIWNLEPEIKWPILNPLVNQLVVERLAISPERLFLMSGDEMWLPQKALDYISQIAEATLLDNSDGSLRYIGRQQFRVFLKDCSLMQKPLPSSHSLIRRAPAKKAYRSISAYMHAIQRVANGPRDTLADLTQLCESIGPQNLIHEKPCLLIAACFYLDAAASWYLFDRVRDGPLLKVILKACGTTEGSFIYTDPPNPTYEWTGLDDAINAIYKHHNPYGRPWLTLN